MGIIIVAATRFYREGLAMFFAARDGFGVAGTAEDVEGVVALARRARFDVALLDMTTPRVFDILRIVRLGTPTAGVVALGVREEEREVISLAEAGVAGFIARNASLEELASAVESAARGETTCSARVAGMLVRRIAILTDQISAARVDIPLTKRQLEIVRLIEEGLPNKAIAAQLFIAVPTVKNHVHNILERLGVSRREEAASAVRRLETRLLPR